MKYALMGLALALAVVGTGCDRSTSSTVTDAPPGNTSAVEEPNQDNLQMICTGSITVNDIDFTAYFTREAGFSQIELKRPATGEVFADSTLNFDGQNEQGQSIWRGNVAGMATVTLVHLSQNPAQMGDEISVGYDGQWGRGTCS